MTTQFTQQVPYTFLLRLAPDNSYFILCPRIVSVASDKYMNFYGYGSFSDFNPVMPHYSPPTPVDFNQFGSVWCSESLTAYFQVLGLSNYLKEFHYEGVVFQPNGNNQSASGINECLLVGRLEIYNQIDTDFDNLFSDLISQITSSAVSIVTQLADTNTNLLSVILNLTNISGGLGNIKNSLDNLNIDIGDVDIQTDNLVTQLQNIYTILASQNSNQAAISSAITNKDNQSNIVDKLDSIFMYSQANGTRRNIFNGAPSSNRVPDTNASSWSLMGVLNMLRCCFHTDNPAINASSALNTKLIANLLALNGYGNDSTGQIPNNVSSNITNSVFKQIRDKITNIETKLEQNLPFKTEVNNALIIDGQQEFRIRDKNEETFD